MIEDTIQYPSTKVDPRIEGKDVYLFDTCSLSALIITGKIGSQPRVENAQKFIGQRRGQPKLQEECIERSIDQLLTVCDFIESHHCVIAPIHRMELNSMLDHQRSIRRSESTVAEKRYGAVQYGTYDLAHGLDEIRPTDYTFFFEIAMQARDALAQSGTAPWQKEGNKTAAPSPTDLSIAATTAALAYSEERRVVGLSRDSAIRAILRKIPDVLGFGPAFHYIITQSVFKDVNGKNFNRVDRSGRAV